MYVIKRNKTHEIMSFDKIYKRIMYLTAEPYPLEYVNAHTVAQHVIQDIYDGVTTSELDTRSAIVCANLSIQNAEYGVLAGRLVISNHQKNTLTSFKDKIDKLYLHQNERGELNSIINNALYKFVAKNQKAIEKQIDYSRDFLIDFFGFKTLEKSYLLKINGTVIERPQDMFMRVAISIHLGRKKNLADIFETYNLMSLKYYTHATPTLFNSGLPQQQLASCFLLGVGDSIDEIFKALSDCAHISKWSGGIGFHVSDIRSKGSYISGTGGTSSGLIPFLKIFERTAIAVNQGGRRNGSFSPYIEMHHPDIMDYLLLCRKNLSEEFRANKLFLALWISDLFMEKVKNDQPWSTFCPSVCPGLSDCYGDEYRQLYERYEREGLASWTRPAREIWIEVFKSQKESGFPYILFKDAVNRNSNQKNIGVIKSSNLCSEIVEYSDTNEYAVCTLASLCLPQFVEDSYSPEELELPESERRKLNHEFPSNPIFNYEKFKHTIDVAVRNLNHVINVNHYPVPETKRSNLRHRPIGLGVQGLADVFFKFNTTFDSPEAKQLNKYIFETLYYTAVSTSTKMCREQWIEYKRECESVGKITIQTHPIVQDNGKVIYKKKFDFTQSGDIPQNIASYSTFEGSPLSQGQFHWEMMGLKPEDLSTKFDWDSLRSHIQTFGMMNSLLIALMPTASTSQIMGNIECFEPLMSNIFIRPTIAGEFIVVNKYLVHDLTKLGLWNKRIENWLKVNNGSIQSIDGIPDYIKKKYRTVWEISQKVIIDLASDRAPFVDQSQSLNLHIQDLTFPKFNAMHLYSWQKGLKTGCYYLRSQEAVTPEKFTVDENALADTSADRVQMTYTPAKIVGPTESCEVCSG